MKGREVSVYIDQELYSWVQTQIREKKYRNISHAIDRALQEMRTRERNASNTGFIGSG